MTYKQIEDKFTKFKTFLRKCFYVPEKKEEIHSDADRKKFAALPPEHKLELIKPQLEFFTSAVSRKTDILPQIATLAATLIVVATLNNSLIPLTIRETKIILSVFLILIPLTLHYYIKIMEKTAKGAMNTVASYQGLDPSRNIKITFLSQLSSDFPIIIVYIFYGVVLFILFRMWHL